MLTINFVRENPEKVIDALKVKYFDATKLVAQLLEQDEQRRKIQTELDNTLSELNNLSKEIGLLFKAKKSDEAENAKQNATELSEQSKKMRIQLSEVESMIHDILVQMPNMPHHTVPHGRTPEQNLFIRGGGEMPVLYEGAKPHWDIIKEYDIIDFDLGNKITGAGFPVYKRAGARLQRALINFFLDEARNAGYDEVIPPFMVNEASGFGTGQLPDKEGQMYHVTVDNFYLIPTAEVPVTNIFRDVILDEKDFPLKYTAYSPCFRREAGAWGRDVRGLNRLHQFDKVEIVQIQHPEKSYESLEGMVNHVEQLVTKLELPYRIIKLCGGDMSFTSALTYDFEVFSAAQEKWLEVSSVSNFESYQANRLKLRYRDLDSKRTNLAHTLNGSALALPRILAAIIENNQTSEGIRIPRVLVPYTGFDIITKNLK
jgi:seryl-tRNA synthetase